MQSLLASVAGTVSYGSVLKEWRAAIQSHVDRGAKRIDAIVRVSQEQPELVEKLNQTWLDEKARENQS